MLLLEQVKVSAEQEDAGGYCHDGDEEAENGRIKGAHLKVLSGGEWR